MKHIAFISGVLLACSTLIPMTVSADDDTIGEKSSGDYTYTIDSETGNAVINGYSGSDSNLVIPDKLDEYSVSSIDANAFYKGGSKIETVTIPSSLEEIGDNAFFDCTSIKEFIVDEKNENFYTDETGVLFRKSDNCLIAFPPASDATSYTVPDGVTEIHGGAMAKCNNLKEITLPDGLVYIDDWAFAYNTFSKIDIPDSVAEICDYSFAYCENVTSWKLPESLVYIGNAAFANCTGMKEVVIPSHVTSVGMAAFVGTGLTEVTIPPNIETIGYCAFGYKDMENAVDDFVIYGQAGGAAAQYATDSDEDNSYSNSFTFVTVSDATVPRGGASKEEDSQSTQPNVTITKEKEPKNTGKIILLSIGAAVLVIGGGIILFTTNKRS
ncbi:MAG: leucine-rich repeat domain-containing protein [Ruminococcus sp.]|nr:leucine-rich repeat domain-containing protein [Ruminococcus sp.]